MANDTTPAKAQVYGPGNLGLATRLTRESPNLFNLIQREEAKAAADEAAKAKARQQRGKEFTDLLKWSPEKAWMPYTDEIKKRVHETYDYASKVYSDRDPTNQEKAEIYKRQTDLDADVKRTNEFKKAVEDAVALAANDPEINQQALEDRLGSIHVDDKGNLRPISELNPELITELYEDPSFYNRSVIAENFAKSIPEQIRSMVDPTMTGHDEITIKSKFVQLDEDGNTVYDENGKAVPNITNEMVALAMNTPNMKLQVEAAVQEIMEEEERTDVTAREGLTKVLDAQMYEQERINREESAYKRQQLKISAGKKEEKDKITHRRIILDRIAKGHEKEIGLLVGGKHEGKTITNAEYDYSGKGKGLSLTLVGKDGAKSTSFIDLSGGDAENTLNNIVNSIQTESKDKITSDRLMEVPDPKPAEYAGEVDYMNLNKDIQSIQTNPTTGKDLLLELPNVLTVEYQDKGKTGQFGKIVITERGKSRPKIISITKENKGGYVELQKYLLKNKKETYIKDSAKPTTSSGSSTGGAY
jgi:hypothetical protein